MTSRPPSKEWLARSVESQDNEIQLLEYWRVLVRRRNVVLGCLAVSVVATMILTFLATPTYRATATLEIERQAPEILEFTDVVGIDPAGYQDFYRTQYRILQSQAVTRLAAERMDLVSRPEYAGRKGTPIGRLLGWLGSLGGSDEDEEKADEDPLVAATGFISGRLSISPVRNSHLVWISSTDRDPQLAADMANAVAEAYQQFQLNTRYDTTGKAKEFLTKDVARYKDEVAKLERELQAYGKEQEIVGFSDGTLDISEQALGDINRRYTEVKSRLATAEARHRAIQEVPPDALPEVLNSQTIAHLRQQHAELERRYSQMAGRFNEDWPPLIQLQQELQTAAEQLETEQQTIAGRVRGVARSDFLQARAEVENLALELDREKLEVQRVNAAAIEYASLREQIETKRKVMNDLVERQSETETSFRLKDTSTGSIRIVDRAETPLSPASPRKLWNLILSVILGTALGAGMAFLIDHLDNTVKTESDVERISGVTLLGHVPLTNSLQLVAEGDNAGLDLTARLDLASHLDPRSNFAESFRNLRTALLLASPDRPARSVAVTSCEPGDGKSTVALNLAIVLTQLGRRVLLVDADLRRPRIHKVLRSDGSAGLSSFLSGNASPDALVQETGVPNLWTIPSGPIPPNPSELLGSPRLLELIADDQPFDHVIFDSPPVLSVTDAILLSTHTDGTILVVRAGETSRDALARSSTRLAQSRTHVIGAVLNAVSSDTGYYYGRYGRGYYRPYEMDETESAGKPTARGQQAG